MDMLVPAVGSIRSLVAALEKGTAVLLMAERMQQSRALPCNSKQLWLEVSSFVRSCTTLLWLC